MKNTKMRNMKSLHIFQIIVMKREEKFQGSLWEYEKPKVNVTFSFERRVGTSLLILYVDWLMRVDYSPHSL